MNQNDTSPAVKLEGVTKSFNDRRVLDNITLEVAQGRGFCLLGRSGTGKSVTLKHIIGLLRPDSGLCVHGKDVTAQWRELADVRRSMGFLFQTPPLFDSISVGEERRVPDAAPHRLVRFEDPRRGAGEAR
jgi:phospholipid/cholesterol/gamma-HCH transport system ATP-binding protein